MTDEDLQRGPEGREGAVGREGTAGREGPVGEPGKPGIDGAAGEQGARGRQGAALPKRVTRSFVLVIVCAFISLTVMGWQIAKNRHLAKQGKEAHQALCVLKTDYRNRIKLAEEYLYENPEGSSAIPVETIRTAISNQKSTLKSLAVVACSEDELASGGVLKR